MTKEIVIEAGRTERQYWKDVWTYRELFYFLAWRDILVRYKQTAIGVAWALLRPFLKMVVLTVVFGGVAGLPPVGDAPYAIVVFAGVLPWDLFSTGLTSCSNSLVMNKNMLSKIYFPRLVVPSSSIIVSLVDFGVSCSILIGLMGWYEYLPSWRIVTVPLFLAIVVALTLGLGLWMATLNVEYRDFRYIVPFVTQIGLYISPVGFSNTKLFDLFGYWCYLNPMYGVIEGFRWAILDEGVKIFWPGIASSAAIAAFLIMTSIAYFRRMERTFADVI